MYTNEQLVAMSKQMNPAQTQALTSRLLDEIREALPNNKDILARLETIQKGLQQIKQEDKLKDCCQGVMRAYIHATSKSANVNQLFATKTLNIVTEDLNKVMSLLPRPRQVMPPKA